MESGFPSRVDFRWAPPDRPRSALAEITSLYSITSSAPEASRLTYRVVGHFHSCNKDAERRASMNRSRSWDNMNG